MLQFVFDESGHFRDHDMIAMAGCVATGERWDECSKAWRDLLDEYGLPFIHMKEFFPLQGVYKKELGWERNSEVDQARRDEVVQKAIGIMRKFMMGVFGVAFDSKHYRTKDKAIQKTIGKPELFCFRWCLKKIVTTLKQYNYPHPIALVMDDDRHFAMKMYDIFHRAKQDDEDHKRLLGSICFADDDKFPPLQAADILAWITGRKLRTAEPGIVPFWDTLVEPNPENQIVFESAFYDSDEIDSYLERLRKHGVIS